MKGHFAWILERKYITYKKKEYEIFRLKDFVFGLEVSNKEEDICLTIISGFGVGNIYPIIGTTHEDKSSKYCIALLNEEKVLELNQNEFDILKIREKLLEEFNNCRYYVRSKTPPIKPLNEQEFIKFLEEQERNEFNENMFEKTTDISKLYSSIRETIVSQDEQIMQILTALFKNQKVINEDFDIDLINKLKENILIYGPTGTGKTEIVKRIAKNYNVPIVVEDSTLLSETGYEGKRITNLLENLYNEANKDVELAEKGILVLDEFDKLAEKPGEQTHVSRMGVQRGLLKLLDGSTFYLGEKYGGKKFDTSKLTIVVLGAFQGINKEDNYKEITTTDFVKYGIMQELIGRFSKKIPMNKLTKEDIKKILLESNLSPLYTYKKLFDKMSIEFSYDESFLDWMAERAVEENTGARSLKTVFDDCISSAMFRIFAGEYSSIMLSRPDSSTNKPYTLTKKK